MARSVQGIQKATRRGARARIALFGPTGGGKTWTALSIASVLADEKGVLLVDSEHGEASLYAEDFAFDTYRWDPPFAPPELGAFLKQVGSQYGCVVVDSISHFYNGPGGLLEQVDAAAARGGGNKFAGWKVGTPMQQDLIEALRRLPCHLIVTARSKMEYVLEPDSRGKQIPRKVGLAPQQREGFEYEMTLIGELNLDHQLIITKSRYSAVADKLYQPRHEKEFAEAVRDWLATAAPEEEVPDPTAPSSSGTDGPDSPEDGKQKHGPTLAVAGSAANGSGEASPPAAADGAPPPVPAAEGSGSPKPGLSPSLNVDDLREEVLNTFATAGGVRRREALAIAGWNTKVNPLECLNNADGPTLERVLAKLKGEAA